MTRKTPQIITFGCRLNTYESEVIRTLLENKPVDAQEDAQEQEVPEQDVIIFNTCGVTAEAERQARQAIRKARREQPHARIIVTGCAAQMNPHIYGAMDEVDLVLGNEEKLKAESYRWHPEQEALQVNDILSVRETALHLVSGFENKARAFIQVQNGCNHRCTFCRIPFGRGNSRSVPLGEIVAACAHLTEQGYQEIVLTGVDITDYGGDLPGKPTLGQAVRRLLALVPGIKRLRLSSLDPVEMDDELLTVICTDARLMPHIHLSVQSGDNLILKRMKRRHLREDVMDICTRIQERRSEVVFGADIIAGFPTETEDMFQQSLRLVEEIPLVHLHVFPYSAHVGTPAARMPQVAKPLIKERAARLRALGEQQLSSFLNSLMGQQVHILVEQDNKGHTETFAKAQVLGEVQQPGTLISGKVLRVEQGALICKAGA